MEYPAITSEYCYQILVVDDLPEVRCLLKRILECMGHIVVTADSAEQALRSLDEYRAEVIFSDISMPEMDGYEFVRKLRMRPDTQQLYIIAMTGNGDACSEYASLVAGFDAHVPKPFGMERIRETLSALSARSPNDLSPKANLPRI